MVAGVTACGSTVVGAVVTVVVVAAVEAGFLGGQLTSGISLGHTRSLANGTQLVASCGWSTGLTSAPLSCRVIIRYGP